MVDSKLNPICSIKAEVHFDLVATSSTSRLRSRATGHPNGRLCNRASSQRLNSNPLSNASTREDHPKDERGRFTSKNRIESDESRTSSNDHNRSTVSSLSELLCIAKNRHGTISSHQHDFLQVDANFAARVKDAINVDVTGFWASIKGDRLSHILKEHTKEKRKGQLPITDSDVESLPSIISDADRVEKTAPTGQGAQAIKVFKRINGHVTVVMMAATKKKKLRVLTMYKYPAGQKQDTYSALPHTSETFTGMSSAAHAELDVAAFSLSTEEGRSVKQYSAKEGDRWITVRPQTGGTGQPVLIDKDGVIKAGMGGKFNGKKISKAGKSDSKSKQSKEPNDGSKKPKNSSPGSAIDRPAWQSDDLQSVNRTLKQGFADSIMATIREFEASKDDIEAKEQAEKKAKESHELYWKNLPASYRDRVLRWSNDAHGITQGISQRGRKRVRSLFGGLGGFTWASLLPEGRFQIVLSRR